ncbi:uncharacterized protein BDW43DRAFT_137306 [Aspergillus alliaceus]|uniref:uncharacterized protein n=1 Tax=Petromyces alliaceus TaxID=209559 RepID=UPI0012A70A61|nr:uncharacterized protein BDW43DRAFT_137306 [Aspergillus alliaceus]KAB8231448.1 hypothetical protein BDW43DRAFT_137306 [Aspergillus alliaceus]
MTRKQLVAPANPCPSELCPADPEHAVRHGLCSIAEQLIQHIFKILFTSLIPSHFLSFFPFWIILSLISRTVPSYFN